MLEITGNVQTIPVEGTDPTIDAQSNCRYMCGEVNTISITPSLTGICNFVFTSGSSPAVLTLPSTVKMPEWFDINLNQRNPYPSRSLQWNTVLPNPFATT